tara:strand:- start:103 stop:468 length:366 start_codon:yes stop_codon:yes gene_type:complete
MVKLKDLLTEAKGKQIYSMWIGIRKENAKLRADAMNKANIQAEKNIQKLVGTEVWDNKEKLTGKIISVKFDENIKAKSDQFGYVTAGSLGKFSAVIQWENGKKYTISSPYLYGNEPVFLNK